MKRVHTGFHTGIAKTHIRQDHTKHTHSKRHPTSDDGGVMGKSHQEVWQPHVDAKQHRLFLERLDAPGPSPGYFHPPHTSLGQRPPRDPHVHLGAS